MRHPALFSGTALALLASTSVMANDTANLKVSGVISPAVCSVSLAGGASGVRLDPVKLADFTPGEDLALAPKDASLTIDCQGAAARFRLKATDSSSEGVSEAGSNHFSLGRNTQGGGNKANGYFALSIDTASMPANKYVLKSTDSGVGEAWAQPVTGAVPFDKDGEAFAFAADAAATEPADLATLTVPLKIAAVLAKDPIVTEDVELAGQATIEILY